MEDRRPDRRSDPVVARGFALAIAVAASVLLVVVALPRFGALGEPSHHVLEPYVTADGTLLRATTIDMREYLAAVDHHSGDAPPPDVAPFTRRIGVTWLAGQLPLSAPVAMNVVVLGFLVVGLWALVALQRRLGLSALGIGASSVTYAAAFPVFYWGSFNYVDGAVVGVLAVVLLALVLRRPGLAAVLAGAGILVKESALVGSIAVLAWVLATPIAPRQRARSIALTVASAAGGFFLASLVAPRSSTTYNPWLPSPDEIVGYVGHNLRPGTLAQVALTVAVPTAGALLAVRHRRAVAALLGRRMWVTLWAGTAAGCLLAVQSLLTAQLDGRTVWTAYPFVLTLGAAALQVAVPGRAERDRADESRSTVAPVDLGEA